MSERIRIPKRRTRLVQVPFSVQEHEDLKRRAKEHQVSMSQEIRDALSLVRRVEHVKKCPEFMEATATIREALMLIS